MSEFLHKPHNVSVFLYHIECPAKYRRAVISDEAGTTLKEACGGIEKRHGIKFL
jgi:hypothetical protein